MDIHSLISQDPIAQGWSPATRDRYLDFYRRLSNGEPLTIKIGKGGLGFYKPANNRSVFVCHFNAAPQRGRADLGFADFRFDALRPYLNVDQAVEDLRHAALPDVQIKVNKLWCSLHFPLVLADHVADLFVEHIISKVE